MEQKRGEGTQKFKKGGGQAGSKGGCLKTGVLEPPYELLLNWIMKVHPEKFPPIENYSNFIQQLLRNLYVVGDLSNSFNNVEHSFKFYEVSKKCLAESSFKLHKWATNNYELAKWIKLNESDTTEIPNADDETYVKDFLGNSYTYQKVLGVNWNATTDKFVFEFSNIINIASKLNVTKRNILKVSAMFFDPLGLNWRLQMYNQIYPYFQTIFSKFQCGFRKGFNAQHCLLAMVEKWRKTLDGGGEMGAVFTDLSKAFDCIDHN